MTKKLGLLALCLPMATACVDQSTWSPIVDTFGSSRSQFVQRDTEECRQLAMRTSGSTTRETATGAIGGGLLGAAAGAAIGAAAGSAGRGAAIGAAAGGIGGGAVRASQSNAQFQRAFNQCMRNRGHTVLS